MPRSSLVRPYLALTGELRLQERAAGPAALAGYNQLWAEDDDILNLKQGSDADVELAYEIPTQANTGFSSWLNQGSATITDNPFGMTLYAPATAGDQFRCLYKTAPATPYTITARISINAKYGSSPSATLGWLRTADNYFQGVTVTMNQINGLGTLTADGLSSPATGFTRWWDVAYTPSPWVRLTDDGTNFTIEFASDRNGWLTGITGTKAGGYLGAAGYNRICLIANTASAALDSYASLLYYKEA